MAPDVIRAVVGNSHDHPWAERLAALRPDHLELDQWSAQRSRFVAFSEAGRRVAVALERGQRLRDGDILRFDAERGEALVVRLRLSQVLVIDLAGLEELPLQEHLQTLFELGHAIGNQHWPAVIHRRRLYLPLVMDRKVMESVLLSHRFAGISHHFEEGQEVIPHLSPHEIRRLFGGSITTSGHHPHHHPHLDDDDKPCP